MHPRFYILYYLYYLYYCSKLVTLRVALEGITSKRRNSYRSHHTSSEVTDLSVLKDIYVELAALRSYCDLNQTGFYKIIKKYDKIMEVREVRINCYLLYYCCATIIDYSNYINHYDYIYCHASMY